MPQVAPPAAAADAPFGARFAADDTDPPYIPHPMLARADFWQLHRARRRFAWSLTAIMLVAYFGFILTLAFRPDLLARQIVAGEPMSAGIPIGFGMFAFTFAMVAVYVYRTNTVYDRMIADVRAGAQS
ncbi:DUF485 domain-containing protein [Cupriavidus sp. H39]|uniref:DUF485 domain-containing protein n=1 Tax=Cupriavidus sp. H39 TaxID=3401635 RepID=UPI003D007D5E